MNNENEKKVFVYIIVIHEQSGNLINEVFSNLIDAEYYCRHLSINSKYPIRVLQRELQ